MKQELKDLAKHRLERAENTLLDAQKYFENATLDEITFTIMSYNFCNFREPYQSDCSL